MKYFIRFIAIIIFYWLLLVIALDSFLTYEGNKGELGDVIGGLGGICFGLAYIYFYFTKNILRLFKTLRNGMTAYKKEVILMDEEKLELKEAKKMYKALTTYDESQSESDFIRCAALANGLDKPCCLKCGGENIYISNIPQGPFKSSRIIFVCRKCGNRWRLNEWHELPHS